MGFHQASDAELVVASQAGDFAAFSQIVKRYEQLVWAVGLGATGDKTRSDDVAQETFLNAWRGRRALRDPAKLRSWLCAIARNVSYKAIRRDGREVPSGLDISGDASTCVGATPTPLQEALRRESDRIVWHAVRRLPASYREPLVLFHQMERSVDQVATDLGLSVETVKKRLQRARRLLKGSVGEDVGRVLSKCRPSTGTAAAVLAAISFCGALPEKANASSTALTTMSTVTKGGLIMSAKTGVAVALVALAVVIFLLMFTHEDAASLDRDGPSIAVVDEARPAPRAANAAAKIVTAADAKKRDSVKGERVDDASGELVSPRAEATDAPSTRWVIESGGVGHAAIKAAGANGLRQCFDTMQFSSLFSLSLEDGRVRTASLVGEHPFGDAGSRIEKCVLEAFDGVEVSAGVGESIERLWYSLKQVRSPPPPDEELYRALAVEEGTARGSDEALVTLVAFVDYKSPYSSQIIGTIDQLLEEYEGSIRVVFKQFPVSSEAELAAEAALAAAAQGEFWAMHNALFADQSSSASDYLRFAVEFGIDEGRFASDSRAAVFARLCGQSRTKATQWE